MLFRVGRAMYQTEKLPIHSSATSRKRLNSHVLVSVGKCFWDTKGSPTCHPELPISQKHCKSIVFSITCTIHNKIFHTTLHCDRRQTVEIHAVLRHWSKSGCELAPCWWPERTCQHSPTRGNSCCFALGAQYIKRESHQFIIQQHHENVWIATCW